MHHGPIFFSHGCNLLVIHSVVCEPPEFFEKKEIQFAQLDVLMPLRPSFLVHQLQLNSFKKNAHTDSFSWRSSYAWFVHVCQLRAQCWETGSALPFPPKIWARSCFDSFKANYLKRLIWSAASEQILVQSFLCDPFTIHSRPPPFKPFHQVQVAAAPSCVVLPCTLKSFEVFLLPNLHLLQTDCFEPTLWNSQLWVFWKFLEHLLVQRA